MAASSSAGRYVPTMRIRCERHRGTAYAKRVHGRRIRPVKVVEKEQDRRSRAPVPSGTRPARVSGVPAKPLLLSAGAGAARRRPADGRAASTRWAPLLCMMRLQRLTAAATGFRAPPAPADRLRFPPGARSSVPGPTRAPHTARRQFAEKRSTTVVLPMPGSPERQNIRPSAGRRRFERGRQAGHLSSCPTVTLVVGRRDTDGVPVRRRRRGTPACTCLWECR